MTEPNFDAVKAAKDEMSLAIASAIERWAELENDLAALLERLLESQHRHLGHVIYYAPSSTETRIAILDSVLTFTTQFHPFGEEIRRCWDEFTDKFRTLKNTRNAIVHGNVMTYTTGNLSKFKVRLVPPIFDELRYRKAIKPRQYPGMAAREVEQAGKNFLELRQIALLLWSAIWEGRQPNVGSSPQKLDELKARLNLTDFHPVARTPTKHSFPPQSSRQSEPTDKKPSRAQRRKDAFGRASRRKPTP